MSVGAGLRQQGHFVKLWDGPIENVPLDFDGYGFGPTTPEYPTAVKAMQRLRYCEQKPRIVLGGAGATTVVCAEAESVLRGSAIGTGVLGGMVTATVLVVVFAPLFYVVIERIFGRKGKRERAKTAVTNPSGDQ